MTPKESMLTEAVDVLACALIDHGHEWAPYERSLYENATDKKLESLFNLVTGNRFDRKGNELNLKADPDFFNMSDEDLDL